VQGVSVSQVGLAVFALCRGVSLLSGFSVVSLCRFLLFLNAVAV